MIIKSDLSIIFKNSEAEIEKFNITKLYILITSKLMWYIMKKLSVLLFSTLISILLPISLAQDEAEQKIAIVDVRRALIESEPMKKEITDYNNSISGEVEELENLRKELTEMQNTLTRESDTLSPKQRELLEQEFSQKRDVFAQRNNEFNSKQQSREQSFMEQFQPTIERAISEIMEEEGITLVLHWQAVVTTTDNSINITDKLLEKLNQASPAE